jgi:hypothetical protein
MKVKHHKRMYTMSNGIESIISTIDDPLSLCCLFCSTHVNDASSRQQAQQIWCHILPFPFVLLCENWTLKIFSILGQESLLLLLPLISLWINTCREHFIFFFQVHCSVNLTYPIIYLKVECILIWDWYLCMS